MRFSCVGTEKRGRERKRRKRRSSMISFLTFLMWRFLAQPERPPEPASRTASVSGQRKPGVKVPPVKPPRPDPKLAADVRLARVWDKEKKCIYPRAVLTGPKANQSGCEKRERYYSHDR